MMNKVTVVALMLVVTNVLANEGPETMFPTSANFTNTTTIKWITVDNVQARCEKESHKRKFGGFGYAVEACSFWDKGPNNEDLCTIVTGKYTNMHTLGHETRHCFQGSFHK
jgi:hypothetical protein